MHRIEPTVVECAPCQAVTDAAAIQERFQELLGDESRLHAESVSAVFVPESAAQVADALRQCRENGWSCIVSGARTGIAGGAVPVDAEAVISLTKLDQLLALGQEGEEFYVRTQPAVTLARLREILEKKTVDAFVAPSEAEAAVAAAYQTSVETTLWFPVDPTEQTAHLGGIVATNASGARTYRYGPTRDWVRGLTVLLADGRLLTLKRGDVLADGMHFTLVNANGSETTVALPETPRLATKATLGYASEPGMDLIDLFVGSEGTLGVIVEAELRLAVRPPSVLGVVAVVGSEAAALDLVEGVRARDDLPLDALEYFDPGSLSMLKAKKDADGLGSHIPDLPSWEGAAVYLEISGTEDETEAACELLEEILDSVGSSLDDTWAAMDAGELDGQKDFRHAVPEAVNTFIGQHAAKTPGLHKVGTDMAVPDERLRDVFALYRKGLAEAELNSVIFGHIGNNHVHVNILPEDLDQLVKAKELYLDWAKGVVAMGGAVAAEHGIGRIKKSMLAVQYDPAMLESMRAIRQAFDPEGMLAPGVLV